jgi:hypothetical protein
MGLSNVSNFISYQAYAGRNSDLENRMVGLAMP